MSRSGYSEDWDGDGSNSMNLYRNSVDRAMRGKRGQVFFVDLLAALDALPEKKLIAGELVEPDGAVCAIGALGKARGLDMTKMDPEDAYRVGATFGIAQTMAREVVYENDEQYTFKSVVCKSCHGWGERPGMYRPQRCGCQGGFRYERIHETPEERFVRMRAWVASSIKIEAVAA